ncbi:MAG TPA: sarcosine oxidase subunit delta [Candidatus Acidoferrales bacterium]|nr:sarcosine oxidase subunit delta [Candidatus Acidoferrales bacterium]
MKIMRCPLNGARNITEFVCGGEVKPLLGADPDPRALGRSIYFERNRAGLVWEWWMHVPSAYWFIARRDTRTDEIVRTLTFEEFTAEQVAAREEPVLS